MHLWIACAVCSQEYFWLAAFGISCSSGLPRGKCSMKIWRRSADVKAMTISDNPSYHALGIGDGCTKLRGASCSLLRGMLINNLWHLSEYRGGKIG